MDFSNTLKSFSSPIYYEYKTQNIGPRQKEKLDKILYLVHEDRDRCSERTIV